MRRQANSQTRLFSAARNDRLPRLLAAGVPERFEREREKDRRGARRGRSFLFCRLQLGPQSLALFGELFVLRLQIGDPPRLRLRAAPLRLAVAQSLRKSRAQPRSLNHQPCPAEADERRGGYTQGETKAARQPGELRQPDKSCVGVFDPLSRRRLRRSLPGSQILVHYLSQSPGEHYMPPPGFCNITLFEAFTIGLGERAARRGVEQLIFDFTEQIVFGLVAEILVFQRVLFRP